MAKFFLIKEFLTLTAVPCDILLSKSHSLISQKQNLSSTNSKFTVSQNFAICLILDTGLLEIPTPILLHNCVSFYNKMRSG